jgi:flagellar biosynthesis GTPase FlhF
MTIWVELRCTGPSDAGNGCPEGHGARGIGLAVADSHAALKSGYADILKRAEGDGWQRDTKMLALRCPHCAAAFASADPVEIAGIPWEKFVQGVELCVSGRQPSSWAGRDGFPTATQFRNALNRFPSLRRRYDQAPAFKGGRGKARAAPVSDERWAAVLDRLKAGETVAAIAAGADGWPTIRQWHTKLAADAAFKTAVDAIRAEVKPVRQPRAAPSAEAVAARKARREAKTAANALLREDRRRLRAAARADEKEARRQQKAREAIRRNEELRRERAARRVEKERERVALAEKKLLARATQKQRDRAEAKARKVRSRAIMRKSAVRFRAVPASERFERRLSPPTSEGCRHFIGPIPSGVDIGNRQQMKPERAALFFAGIAVPKGHVVEHTCWNDDCFATDHLRPTPDHPMKRPAPTIPTEIIDAAAAIVTARFGVGRADLNGTVDRKRGTNHTAFARQVFRYLLSVELEFSQPMVARATDCDRTTITHGNHLVEDRRDDEAFDQVMDELAAELRRRITKEEEHRIHGWPA